MYRISRMSVAHSPELERYTADGGCMGGVPLSIGLMYEVTPPGGDCRLDDRDVPVDTGELPAVELVTPPPPTPPFIVGDILLLLLTEALPPPPDDFPDDLEPLLPELPVELFLDDAVLSVPVPLWCCCWFCFTCCRHLARRFLNHTCVGQNANRSISLFQGKLRQM